MKKRNKAIIAIITILALLVVGFMSFGLFSNKDSNLGSIVTIQKDFKAGIKVNGTEVIDSSGNTFINSSTPVNAVAATSTWTPSGEPSEGDTFTIGDITYTLTATSTEAYDITLGAGVLDNIAAAINGGAGEGSAYGTGTVAHPDVTAVAGDPTFTVTAKVAGTAGNSIAVSTTGGNASWSASTLEGGVTGDSCTAGQIAYDASYLYLCTASDSWERSAVSSY